MHLVLIAWLYVIGMMAVTADSIVRGLVLFVIGGVLPVLGLAWWRGRQRSRTRPASSALEHHVHDRDHGDS